MSKVQLKPGDYVRTEGMTEEQLQAVAQAFIDAGCPEKRSVPSLEMALRFSRFGWAEGGHGLLRGDGAILLVGRELTIEQVLGEQEPSSTIEQLLAKANRHASKAAKHERKRAELVERADKLKDDEMKAELEEMHRVYISGAKSHCGGIKALYDAGYRLTAVESGEQGATK